MNRGKSGGECEASRALFELCDLLFQEVARGIAASCVVIAGHRVDFSKAYVVEL